MDLILCSHVIILCDNYSFCTEENSWGEIDYDSTHCSVCYMEFKKSLIYHFLYTICIGPTG